MAGLLDPMLREVTTGTAEVRQIFELSKGGSVAGCVVTNGRITKGKMRLRRRSNILFTGLSASLRRFQDEVHEVRSGLECGIRLDGFNDFQVGDQIECFAIEKVAQEL
jgi:translation initiation factor IF-2